MHTGFTSTRRTFCKYLGAAATTTFFLGAHTLSAHADSHRDATFRHSAWAGINVLLVHGAWVDASSRQGYTWVDPAFFPQDFVQDIDVTKARALAVVQKPITPECFTAKSGPPAWKTVPSWYLVSGHDRAINVDSERFMARRIGATTRQIASSHASPLSHPRAVCEIIVAAAQGAHRHQVKPSDKRAGV